MNTVKTSPKEMAKQIVKSKVKTINTRAKNKASNKVSRLKKDEAVGVIYLKEGVTGKQFNRAKLDTNRAVKQERSSISKCISDAQEFDKGFFSSLSLSKTALKKILRPAQILKHATNTHLINYFNSLEKNGYIRFNVWYTLGYMKRELDGKDVNPVAVQFFELLKVEDNEGMKALIKTLVEAKEESSK